MPSHAKDPQSAAHTRLLGDPTIARAGEPTPLASTIGHEPGAPMPADGEFTISQGAATAPETLPGNGRLGRYCLLGVIKAGGMGVVYKALDTTLDRVVALKMLKAGVLAFPDEVDRFYREAQAIAKFQRPHIVPIYDVGEQDGLHYFTMEYVVGGSLAQHLGRFRNQPRAAAALIAKVARAVHYAHVKGILHRDLKPSNIFLDDQGEPRVGDFGLVKFLYAPRTPVPRPTSLPPPRLIPSVPVGSSDGPLGTPTPTIGVVGTPAYMSPEHIRGEDLTVASDVWSLGIVLYELLTGRRPFSGETREELAEHIRHTTPEPPSELQPGIDAGLEAICLRCLEKDSANRFASAEALADALTDWERGQTQDPHKRTRLRRAGVVAAALVLLAAAVALALFGHPLDPDRASRAVLNQLEHGQTVTLVKAIGQPEYAVGFYGQPQIVEAPERDGTFCILTGENSMLDLQPRLPGKPFRAHAEIRHEDGDKGEVGLVFGHVAFDQPAGREEVGLAVVFGDHERLYRDSQLQHDRNAVHLRLWRGRDRESLALEDTEVWKFYDGTPPPPQPRVPEWRSVDVEVTRDGVEVLWEQESIGVLKFEEIQSKLHQLGEPQPPGGAKRAYEPEHLLSGGLGIYAARATVSIRNVNVRLVDAQP